MNQQLINYEIVNKKTKERYPLTGKSDLQKGSFEYQWRPKCEPSVIHISHIICGGDYVIVYNQGYELTDDDVIYLLNDLGGEWK